MENHRLLYVDDEAPGRDSTGEYLRGHGFEVVLAATAAEALAEIGRQEQSFAAIIVDYNLKHDPLTGAELTRAILGKDPEAYIIVYSSDPSQSAATESWSAGAVGFVKKEPGDMLLERVREQCAKFDEFRSTLSKHQLKSPNSSHIAKVGMVGRSANLAQAAKRAIFYRDSPETVLILGETGAGKEGLARALADPKKTFQAINCATYSNEDLLEGDLFGYEKGAFTGADRQKQGLLQTVGDGTLFMDEIHEMSLSAQGKLLRAFQEKTFRRMNGAVDMSFHCRLVVASKPNLPELADAERFKSDLYYRISKLTITIAPLRERRDDVAPLILYFSEKYKAREGLDSIFRSRTVRIMEQYDWPGNVRELDNVVYALLKHCPGRYVEPNQLGPKFFKKSAAAKTTWEQFQDQQFQARRDFILKICESSMTKAHAARQLDIQPNAIHALLKTYDITWDKKDGTGPTAEKVVLQ